MKERLQFFGAYWLLWYLYFIGIKIIFLIYHFNLSQELPFSDWLLILLHGSWLDVAMSSYMLLIPGLVILLTAYNSHRFLLKFLNIYTVFFVIIYSVLATIDYELYRNWGYRIDATPINYMMTASKEIVGQINAFVALKQFILTLLIVGVALFCYFKKITVKVKAIPKGNWKNSLAFLLITASLILPIRGGFGVAPLNVGFVFFHKNIFANHAAINVIWNFFYSLKGLDEATYPSNFYEKEATEKLFTELYSDTTSVRKVIKNNRPNVIVIILESFTSKMIAPLGGLKNITPNLNKLAKEGILFTNFYANGDRTDKGLIAVMSGYPAQPTSSIIKYPSKTQSLPILSKDLSENGYYTAWTFGNNINFANFSSYLNFAQFDMITEKNDFPTELYINTKWGVPDHFMFEKASEQINNYNKEKPFFWGIMTLSSHEPFEVPMETVIKGNDEESLFLNAAYYADKSLGSFIENAKKQDWWENTLVVITADHGHRLPGNDNVSHDYKKFRIPMLWIGGALSVTDTTISTYGSQSDIATTILQQLDIKNPNYTFGKNLLSDGSKSFAFYDFNNGFGFVNDSLRFVFDNVTKKYSITEGKYQQKDLETGKAYLQKLYTDFNER